MINECIPLNVTDKETYLHDCEKKLAALQQSLDAAKKRVNNVQGEITELKEKIETVIKITLTIF